MIPLGLCFFFLDGSKLPLMITFLRSVLFQKCSDFKG